MLSCRRIIKTPPCRTKTPVNKSGLNTNVSVISQIAAQMLQLSAALTLAAEIRALCQALGPSALKKTTLDLLSGPRSPGQHFRECELCQGGADVSRRLIESALRAAPVLIEWISPETPEEFPDGSERFYPALGMLADRRVWGMSLGICALRTEPWKGGLLPLCCGEGEFPAAQSDTLSKQSIMYLSDRIYVFDMMYGHF